MSASPNLDLVRSIYASLEDIYAALGRGDLDLSTIDWADPEIEYVAADGLSPRSSTGLAGLFEGVRDTMSVVEDYRIEVDGYRELEGERVLVLLHRSGRGKTSGLELGQMHTKGAHLLHIGGGRVTRVVAYLDRERAFADLGLAPEGGAANPPG